jgi:hypothetical protein
MFPQATASSPAASRIASSIPVVVVLPLVPVTASQRGGPAGHTAGSWPSRHASSGSPIISTSAARAACARGESGRKPGLVTTRSHPAGRAATSVVNAAVRSSSEASWPGSESAIVTVAPISSSTSTTDAPVRRAPATSTCAPVSRVPAPATPCVATMAQPPDAASHSL